MTTYLIFLMTTYLLFCRTRLKVLTLAEILKAVDTLDRGATTPQHTA